MLIARSAPECRLYMDLHACSCGQTAFEATHVLKSDPSGALLAVYEGACPRCGLPRQFSFVLGDALPPPPPAFGGPAPSAIICPGEFLAVADQASAAAPLDPAGLSAQQTAAARGALATAAAALDEVVKFIPDGASAVPESAIVSPIGVALYAREPGRFSRLRLEASLEAYREALAAYQAA